MAVWFCGVTDVKTEPYDSAKLSTEEVSKPGKYSYSRVRIVVSKNMS